MQGLFHPARKVREVYWKIYNMLYIGSQVSIIKVMVSIAFLCVFWQDSLTAAYPRIPNGEKNNFIRNELDYFL